MNHQSINLFEGAYDHRLPNEIGPVAILYNDLSTILAAATRTLPLPRGDAALALAVLSSLIGALLRAVMGDRRQLKEMSDWCCVAARRADARMENG